MANSYGSLWKIIYVMVETITIKKLKRNKIKYITI